MSTPLSVKKRSNQQQENRCEESTDHSPCHASCPETGIPWLVLHCSFLNSPAIHFQSGCYGVLVSPLWITVANLRLNYRLPALFTVTLFDVHKETLFSLGESLPFTEESPPRSETVLLPWHRARYWREREGEREGKRERTHGSSKTGSCATGASAYEVGIPSPNNLLGAGGRSETSMRRTVGESGIPSPFQSWPYFWYT